MKTKFLWMLPLLLCLVSSVADAASVRVKNNGAVVRTTPSASGAVVIEVKAGTRLDVLDVSRDWYKVRDPKTRKEGYIAADTVELEPGNAVAPEPPKAGATPGRAGSAGTKRTAAKRAPKPGDWLDQGYVSVNAIYQGGAAAFQQTLSWNYFGEPASATVGYPAKNGSGLELSGGYRVWRNLAVGAGASFSLVSRSVATTVTGTVPSPIYLNQPRALTGGFDADRSEMAIHLQAAWVIPMSPKMRLIVFGGPTVFSVKQRLVSGTSGIQFNDAYPYGAPTATGTNSTDASKTVVGFGGGVDVTYFPMKSRTVGVGGMVRFARGSFSQPESGQSKAVSFDVGGFQAGAGVRVFFGGPKPPAPPARPAGKK